MRKGNQMKKQYVLITASFCLGSALSFGQAKPAAVQLPPGSQDIGKGPSPPSPGRSSTTSPNGPAFYPSDAMRWRYSAVAAYMNSPSPLQVGGGVLAGMGDESAFHLGHIIQNRPSLSADETLTVLDILHNSFAKPGAIQDAGNLKPNLSLQLLKQLQLHATDERVKSRISVENAFLLSLPKTVTRPTMKPTLAPKPGVLPNREDFGLKP